MTILKIKKRNDEIVDFETGKITIAIEKAFIATKTAYTKEELQDTVDVVVKKAEQFFDSGAAPHVESIQDMVEKTLMEKGFFDAAKAYILYRKEHEKQRIEKQQETLQKIEEKSLFVIKSSGKKEKFDERKIRKTLNHATKGYEDVVDIDALVDQCKEGLFDQMKTKDVRKALIMTSRLWIEQDPAYSFITARLLLGKLYKDVIGDDIDFKALDKQYRSTFVDNIKKGVDAGVFSKQLLEFDLKKLSAKLDLERDNLFTYLGIQTLYDRYFARNAKTGQIFETPQSFWMRIAMGLSIDEEHKEEKALEFYNTISLMLFVPSTVRGRRGKAWSK